MSVIKIKCHHLIMRLCIFFFFFSPLTLGSHIFPCCNNASQSSHLLCWWQQGQHLHVSAEQGRTPCETLVVCTDYFCSNTAHIQPARFFKSILNQFLTYRYSAKMKLHLSAGGNYYIFFFFFFSFLRSIFQSRGAEFQQR